MGILRTIFALSVVFAHSWPAGMVFVGGRNAVQLFYMISGFLISYVLVESKVYKKISIFYINRYLRLYPIYFVVAVLGLIAKMIGDLHFFEIYKQIPISADLLLILSNAFLFGQDWVMFSGISGDKLVFVTDFNNSDVRLYSALIAPQAWTLGIELMFYLIAPFVLPKRKLIYVLLFMSLGLRVILIKLGIGLQDPWTYRFFPTELALFLFGALAHQVLMPFYKRVIAGRLLIASKVATLFLILISIFYFLIPINELYKTLFLFSIFILLLPLTFIFQNECVWDKKIGELSYPIYIGHILVIWISGFLLRKIGVTDAYFISISCVLLSFLFAIFLNQFIGQPFEKLRRRLKKSKEIIPAV
jgi:peptidoglycan/LPS O-acetylase OafA/YrhL